MTSVPVGVFIVTIRHDRRHGGVVDGLAAVGGAGEAGDRAGSSDDAGEELSSCVSPSFPGDAVANPGFVPRGQGTDFRADLPMYCLGSTAEYSARARPDEVPSAARHADGSAATRQGSAGTQPRAGWPR